MPDSTETVPLWDPKRSSIVDVPRNVADNLVRTGYHYKTGDDALKEETDQGIVGKAAATAHSYVNSLGFGLPDVALTSVPSMLGGDSIRAGLDRVHKQERDHPNYATAGDVAGYFGPGGLLAVAGKGAEKVGMHALLKAAAEHTPQHLAENLGKDVAAKYTLGQAATRLSGKVGSAVGFGVESGIRGAAKEVNEEQQYDTPYDVEKVFQTFGYDGLTGLELDAAFGVAGEGLRGIRKGISKTADGIAKVYPSKLVKTGKIEVDPEEINQIYLKRTQRETIKTKKKTSTGGGYEKGDTHARVKTHDSEYEETTSKAENEIDDRYDTQTTTKQKPKPSHTVQYKEDIYSDPESGEGDGKRQTPMGFAWGKDAKQHEILAVVRKGLDDMVKNDKVDQQISNEVIQLELDGKQLLNEGKPGDAKRKFDEKKEYTKYLTDKYDDYQAHLDEYFNVMHGHYERFDPAKERIGVPLKKTGVKTTTEISGQEPEITTKEKTKNDNFHYDFDQTKTRRKSVKDALDETKTKFHHDLDKEEHEVETVVVNDKHEPITLKRYKRKYEDQYKSVYGSKIPWEAKGIGSWGAHQLGVSKVAWPLIAADTAIPHVLNERSFYSKQLDRLTVKPAELMGQLVRNLTTSVLNRKPAAQAQLSKALRHPDKLYDAVTNSLQAHANDPSATQQAIQGRWQHALVDHPALQTGLIIHTQKVAQVARSFIPPDTRPPTAQHTPYNPPRSQKVKFLRLFHAINQPLSALENPTPQMMQVIEQTNPETLSLLRRSLVGHIASGKAPFKGKAAQVASMILGEPINPRNASPYLKRLQTTASLDQPATEPSGGNMAGPHAGSIAGPKSAKVQQDAAMLYATPQQLHELA